MSTSSAGPLGRAAGLLGEGRADEARALLADYLHLNPGSADGWFLLSQAVAEPAQQRECLERVLSLDPNHAGARQRLAVLRSQRPAPTGTATGATEVAEKPNATQSLYQASLEDAPTETIRSLRSYLAANAPPPEAPPPPKRPLREQLKFKALPNWRVYALVGLGLFAALGVYALGAVYVPRLLFPVPDVVEFITATASPAAFPTLPPEWTATPQPSPTASPLPTITRTPTVTPTFAPPNETEAASMNRIADQVSVLRGLGAAEDTAHFLVPRERVQDTLSGLVLDADLRASLVDEARALTALGLIPHGYDLARYVLNSAADRIGGFYVPGLRQLFVIGNDFGGVERYIFAHEMTHALQDQHFVIGDFGIYPYCTRNAQYCDAVRALIEGDATLVMGQWLDQFAAEEDFIDITEYDPPEQTLPDESPPDYILKDLAFPYEQGVTFVSSLYRQGNWAAVNRAYADLPVSTEQILHPEKYLAGEAPLAVNDRPLSDALEGNWRLAREDVLGEWATYLLLGYSARAAANLPDEVAAGAAAGWGGDAYQVYFDDVTGEVVLAAHWVWDTQGDADEFLTAMLEYQAARFDNARAGRDDGDCWETGGQASCVFSAGSETLWLLAPNQSLVNELLTLYPFLQ